MLLCHVRVVHLHASRWMSLVSASIAITTSRWMLASAHRAANHNRCRSLLLWVICALLTSILLQLDTEPNGVKGCHHCNHDLPLEALFCDACRKPQRPVQKTPSKGDAKSSPTCTPTASTSSQKSVRVSKKTGGGQKRHRKKRKALPRKQLEELKLTNSRNKRIADKFLALAKKASKPYLVTVYSCATESVKKCDEEITSGDHARELQLPCKFVVAPSFLHCFHSCAATISHPRGDGWDHR